MPRHVVVPLDMSRFAEFALPVAYSVLHEGDSLELVTVLEPPLPLAWDGYEAISLSETEDYLSDIRGRVVRSVGRDVTVTTRIIRGDPALQLSRYVEEADADLVVLTSHGRGPLNRFWLGSVADTFIRHSTVPTIVVRPTEADELELAPWPSPSRVVIPLDGSETSEMVFGKLELLGDPTKLEVHLVRVVTYPRTVASAYMPHTVYENRVTVEEERDWVEDYLDGVSRHLLDRGLTSVDGEAVVAQSAAAGILDCARRIDADVIALVTHGRKGFNRLVLGSIADKVIRAADRPVLVVPSPKELWYAEKPADADRAATRIQA